MPQLDPLALVGQTVVEKYRIEKVVHVGTDAVVYRALHDGSQCAVALKVFTSIEGIDDATRDRWLADLLHQSEWFGALKSPVIVQAHEGAVLTSRRGAFPFIVRHWLEGQTLEELFAGERLASAGPWKLSRLLTMLHPIADALGRAHDRGIAHLDLKPSKIVFVGDAAEAAVNVRLLDLGVERMLQSAHKSGGALGRMSERMSVPRLYSAPEQFARTYGDAGPQTDVFAFGLILARALSGQEPLGRGALADAAYRAMDEGARPTPRTLGVIVSNAVEEVFLKALSVDPRARFKNVREFWCALATAVHAGDEVAASPPTSILAAATSIRTGAVTPSRWKHWAAGAGVIGLVGGAAFAQFAAWNAAKEPPITLTAAASSDPAINASTAAATAALATAKRDCPNGMVFVPGGIFFMGRKAGPDVPANQLPAHPVKLGAYCIDRHEVTVAEYMDCSHGRGCDRADDAASNDWHGITAAQRSVYDPLCNFRDPGERGRHPANCVTWTQAEVYCRSNQKRLPTEAQWEFAARGLEQRRFPWGDDENLIGRLNACGEECLAWGKKRDGLHFARAMYGFADGWTHTSPVGSFPKGASPFGVEDMSGNVFEWVRDVYAPYPTFPEGAAPEPTLDPSGPVFKGGDERTIRGGAWNSVDIEWLRPTFRSSRPPNDRTHGVGFRCAVGAS
jgi:formylglycine-generating enzyme required for sulfatase activity